MPLIVLEGLDGAGTSTQIDLLEQMISGRGKICRRIHFPRFDAPVYGSLIARFLRGELGSIDSVDPYIVALLFAGDRADMANEFRQQLLNGEFLLVDRYVDSNVAYQCAKLSNLQSQSELKNWIYDLEYKHNLIPKPDITIFLDVPFEFTLNSLSKNRTGHDREYLNGADDIHESSLDLQRNVRNIYLNLAREDSSIKVINCADHNGHMSPPKDIFSKIAHEVSHLI